MTHGPVTVVEIDILDAADLAFGGFDGQTDQLFETM
jgi:hypothetical protein